jgi:hypothetical protein
MSDLTSPTAAVITVGVIIVVATTIAWCGYRQPGAQSKRADGGTIAGDGGIGSFDDTAQAHHPHLTTSAVPTATAAGAMVVVATAGDIDCTGGPGDGQGGPKR